LFWLQAKLAKSTSKSLRLKPGFGVRRYVEFYQPCREHVEFSAAAAIGCQKQCHRQHKHVEL
jgi:hypothetical protein